MGGETGRFKGEVTLIDLRRLLVRLDGDPARAWELYEELQRKLVTYFEHHRYYSEAAQLAEEVIDEIARKPDSYKIENVSEFAFGVARNVRLRIPRKALRMLHLEDAGELIGRNENPETTIIERMDAEQKLSCFLHCMKRLSPEERRLLLEYYPADNRELKRRRQRLAEMLDVDLDTLRTRICRLKDRLLACFSSCCKDA